MPGGTGGEMIEGSKPSEEKKDASQDLVCIRQPFVSSLCAAVLVLSTWGFDFVSAKRGASGSPDATRSLESLQRALDRRMQDTLIVHQLTSSMCRRLVAELPGST